MNEAPIQLDRVELIAVSSTQLTLTARALDESMKHARFAAVKFLTHDSDVPLASGIERILTDRIESSAAYSHFMLKRLADFVEADFALIVQWDGYVLNGQAWTNDFVKVDYVGARWPHFADANVVGNGGFSLRSRRLLTACQSSKITLAGAEDLTICRVHRPLLEEEFGIRYASPSLADIFAFERVAPSSPTFGFHGIFNLIDVEDLAEFAQIYGQSDRKMIGDRELKDCLFKILQKAPLSQCPLALRLFMDWAVARRSKGHSPAWLRSRRGSEPA